MSKNHFDVIILNGRPGSGKSEVIDYLKNANDEERLNRFKVGKLDELDDFPMLWTWFEEDDILEKKFNKPRLHSDKEGYFLHEYQWHLLLERISLEYGKVVRDDANFHDEKTMLVEFSRGTEHGGYKEAYKYLSEDLLKRAAIFYVDVSYEESLRKNRRRFNPDKPDSILEHGLPDDKLTRLYKEVDWHEFVADDDSYVTIKGVKVPYVTLTNEPDITTERGDRLGNAMEELFQKLWELKNK